MKLIVASFCIFIKKNIFNVFFLVKIFILEIIEKYGDIVRETPSPGYSIIHIANKDDIEKVLRYPSRYPIRAPSEVIRDYRLSTPERYSSGGLAMEYVYILKP